MVLQQVLMMYYEEVFTILRPKEAARYLEVKKGSKERFVAIEKMLNKLDFSKAIKKLQSMGHMPSDEVMVGFAKRYIEGKDEEERGEILKGNLEWITLYYGKFIRG